MLVHVMSSGLSKDEVCQLMWRFRNLSGSNSKKKNIEGSSGIWTRDLSHPKRESYP